MTRMLWRAACAGLLMATFGAAGCSTSVAPTGDATGGKSATTGGESTEVASNSPSATPGADAPLSPGDLPPAKDHWEGDPDVPYVPIMEDVDGIPIPRLDTKAQTLQLKGEIPADVGNVHAKANPSEPVRGDWLVIRFSSEPKTLNPIVETSAVQSYIAEYVQEALGRLDPETLEYVPNVAEKWVAEDVVKLSPDYKGKERRVAAADGESKPELAIDYPAKKNEKDKDAELTFKTSTPDGQAAPGTWVGFYAVGKIVGAPTNGYHHWSDANGELKVSGFAPGKYTVKVGAEVVGKTEKKEDGSLVVTPAASGNPLAEELKSTGGESLTIPKEDWSDVQEQTVYTYTLRKDVKWSDGTPYTTKDVVFAYAVINNRTVDGESLQVYYQDLVDCRAIDEHTVTMKYRQQYFKSFEFTMGLNMYGPPFHFFEKIFKDDGKTLTLEKLTPEEEEQAKKVSAWGPTFGRFYNTDSRYNMSPMGTGPYMIGTWKTNDRLELVRNPHYWNKERAGYLDKIIVRFIADTTTAFQALRAGEIDFFWNMDTEQYHKDLAGPPDWFQEKYVKAKWYSPGFGYYGWNLLKPMFQDRRVRIALGMMLDKEEFLEQKMYGDGNIVTGSQYYYGPGYDHEVKPLAYSPETARELLAEAGWIDTDSDGVLDKDGKPFSFILWQPPGNPIANERAAIYQKSLKDIGIQMEIRSIEWASFIDKVRSKDFDVVGLGWAQPLESDPYQIWHGSGAGAEKRGSNHVSFSDPLADKLIEQLRLTLDEDKRTKINYSLHRILDREQPYMFLYLPMDHGAYHKRFRGVKWYRVRPGFDLTEWYVPKDEQVHK